MTLVSAPPRFAIRATPIGMFGVAWGEDGILRTWLHGRTDPATRAEILRAFPDGVETEPPGAISEAMKAVAALLGGEKPDLRGATLDMAGVPEFYRRVYGVAREIAPGETMTYGAIAKAMGEEPMQAREVGVALSRNPFAPIVPCHRVVAAGGNLGGYSAPGGTSTKRRLLEIEGAEIVAPAGQQALFD